MSERDNLSWDDSRLLDLIIDGDDASIQALDEAARARLEQLRGIRTEIRAIDEADAVDFRPEQIEAAVAALGRETTPVTRPAEPVTGPGSPAARPTPIFSIRRLAMAAALLLGTLIVVLAIGRGDKSTVYADVFGSVDVYTDGASSPLVRGVNRHGFDLGAGMTVKTRGGCLLNIDDRFRCRAGQNTEFVITEITKEDIHIDLRRGIFRVETPPPTEAVPMRFVVSIKGTQITSEDAVYSVQHLDAPGDHMIVDTGVVTISCRETAKKQRIGAEDGAYRYSDLCPCPEEADPAAKAAFAPRLADSDSCRNFPVQRTPKNALEIAKQHRVPILVTREDGPAIDACFGGDFTNFVMRSRQLAGLVWLVVDPDEHGEYLEKIGLTSPELAVVVDHNSEFLGSSPVRDRDGMCARSLCKLLRQVRGNCKYCPLR